MKKLIAMLLLGAMTLAFAACGGGNFERLPQIEYFFGSGYSITGRAGREDGAAGILIRWRSIELDDDSDFSIDGLPISFELENFMDTRTGGIMYMTEERGDFIRRNIMIDLGPVPGTRNMRRYHAVPLGTNFTPVEFPELDVIRIFLGMDYEIGEQTFFSAIGLHELDGSPQLLVHWRQLTLLGEGFNPAGFMHSMYGGALFGTSTGDVLYAYFEDSGEWVLLIDRGPSADGEMRSFHSITVRDR